MRQKLSTQRLSLRSIRIEDASEIARQTNDPVINRMTSRIPSPNFTLASEFYILWSQAAHREGQMHNYVLTLAEHDQALGNITLTRNSQQQWELGYWLGRDHWGQGLMSEAAFAVINEAFTAMPYAQIKACCFVDNPASRGLLMKLGFTPTGNISKSYSMGRQAKVDSESFTLSMQDYQQKQAA